MANTKNTMTAFNLYCEIETRTTPIEHVVDLLNLLIDSYNLDQQELSDEDKFNLCAGAHTIGSMLDLAVNLLSQVDQDIKALAPEAQKAHAQESAESAN